MPCGQYYTNNVSDVKCIKSLNEWFGLGIDENLSLVEDILSKHEISKVLVSKNRSNPHIICEICLSNIVSGISESNLIVASVITKSSHLICDKHRRESSVSGERFNRSMHCWFPAFRLLKVLLKLEYQFRTPTRPDLFRTRSDGVPRSCLVLFTPEEDKLKLRERLLSRSPIATQTRGPTLVEFPLKRPRDNSTACPASPKRPNWMFAWDINEEQWILHCNT